MTMSDISIHPIFNQAAPRIWDDFLRIRIAAMLVNYDVPMNAQEISDARADYVRDWRRLSHNFAFGAYDDAHMIGYINGAIKSRVAEVFNLYVLPEYQGHKIGRRLLAAADRAVAPFANRMHLVSWPGAETFYRQQGLQSVGNSYEFTKPVAPATCCILPVFYVNPTMTKTCQAIAAQAGMDFSPDVINREHQPMFVNTNIDATIAGFGMFDYNLDEPYPRVITPCPNPQSWTERRLMYSLDMYNIQQNQIKKHIANINGR